MRITQGMITRNYMTSLNGGLENLSKAQQRLSSGRRITRLSENVADGIRALQVRKQMDINYQQQLNVRDAQGVLNTGYDSLKSIESVLHTAKEKAQRAYNGTNASDDRETVANEIRGLMDQVVSFMNVRYADHFIFSGTNNAQPPFTIEEKRLGEGVEITLTADALMTFKAGTMIKGPGDVNIPLGSAQDIILSAGSKVSVNKDGSVTLADNLSFTMTGKTKDPVALGDATKLPNDTEGKTKGATSVTLPQNSALDYVDADGNTKHLKVGAGGLNISLPEGTTLKAEGGKFILSGNTGVTVAAPGGSVTEEGGSSVSLSVGAKLQLTSTPSGVAVKNAQVVVGKQAGLNLAGGNATFSGTDVAMDVNSTLAGDTILTLGADGAVSVPAGTAVNLGGFTVSEKTSVADGTSLRLGKTTVGDLADATYPMSVTLAGRTPVELPANTALQIGGDQWKLQSATNMLLPSGSRISVAENGEATIVMSQSVIIPKGTVLESDAPMPSPASPWTVETDISASMNEEKTSNLPAGIPIRLTANTDVITPDDTVLNGTGGKSYTAAGGAASNKLTIAAGTVVTFDAVTHKISIPSNQKVTLSGDMTVKQTDVKGELGDGVAVKTADGKDYKLNGTSILDKNGKTISTLYYNGVDVDTPGLKSGDIPENGKLYIDLGMGYSIEADGNVDPRTGFEVSFDGFIMLGGGTEDLLDGKGNVLYGEGGEPFQVSNNAYNLLGQVATLLEKDQLTDNEHKILGILIDRVESTRQEFHNSSIADLDNRASFLNSTLEGLENQYDNLIESRSKLEAVDDYRETMNVKMFEYSWFATLKMGNKILPQSLMDFIS